MVGSAIAAGSDRHGLNPILKLYFGTMSVPGLLTHFYTHLHDTNDQETLLLKEYLQQLCGTRWLPDHDVARTARQPECITQ